MKRLILPLFTLFLLTACAEGSHWGEWFPEAPEDEEATFVCDYWGVCHKERSDACDFWGKCGKDEKDTSIWGRKQTAPESNIWGATKNCDFYGNCKSSDGS
jgi:hypothetical protein